MVPIPLSFEADGWIEGVIGRHQMKEQSAAVSSHVWSDSTNPNPIADRPKYRT